MANKSETKPRQSSWTAPSAEDDAAWAAMTRDEQLAALQSLANAPETGTPSGKTVAEIVAETRARRLKTNG